MILFGKYLKSVKDVKIDQNDEPFFIAENEPFYLFEFAKMCNI